MSTCGEYPTVLNGKIASNTSTTVEYECLGGFYISGNQKINCTNSAWGTAPTCNVIRDEIKIFPDWWLIVAIIVGCLLVLACFICLLCYFCCGGYHGNRVRPYDDHAAGCCACCCGSRRDDVSKGGSRAYHTMNSSSSDTWPHGAIFLVPGRPAQGGEWRVLEATLVHSHPPNGKTTSPPAPKHTRAVGTQTTGDVMASPAVVKTPRSWKSMSDIAITPSSYVILHDYDDSVWKGNRRSHQTQTEEDDLLLTSPPNGRPWEKRAKEVRTWMPHRHPVRNINTSTK